MPFAQFNGYIALPIAHLTESLAIPTLTPGDVRNGNLAQIMVDCLSEFYEKDELVEFESQVSLLNGTPAFQLAGKYPDLALEAYKDFDRMIKLKKEN